MPEESLMSYCIILQRNLDFGFGLLGVLHFRRTASSHFAALLQKDCGFEVQCCIFDKYQYLQSLTVRLWDLGVSHFRGTSDFPVTYSS